MVPTIFYVASTRYASLRKKLLKYPRYPVASGDQDSEILMGTFANLKENQTIIFPKILHLLNICPFLKSDSIPQVKSQLQMVKANSLYHFKKGSGIWFNFLFLNDQILDVLNHYKYSSF